MRLRFSTLAVSVGAILTPFAAPIPTAAGAPPVIESQWVSDVTSDDATLNAVINPNGLETNYELQIDTTGRFKFSQSSGCPLAHAPMICTSAGVPGDPLAPGLVQPPEFVLAPGDGGRHVSVNMASIAATLQPGTTYFYRAIASNGFELVEGVTQAFTTPANDLGGASEPGFPSLPLVFSESAGRIEGRGISRQRNGACAPRRTWRVVLGGKKQRVRCARIARKPRRSR